jgi:fucose permease
MSGYETLLFIHVFGAFAVVVGLACTTPLVFAGDVGEPASRRLLVISRALFGLGGLLTLVFGILLTADRDYRFVKAWIIGALVLWLVAAATGNMVSGRDDRTQYATAVAAVAGVFVLMAFKPGV